MGILTSILFGRENGIRASIRRRIFGGGAVEDTSPDSSYSAPSSPSSGVIAGGARKLEPPKDVTPPDGFEVVLHRDALAPGEVTEIIIGGTAIAVVNSDGDYHALSNSCPHAGGPLGEGTMEGSILRCPYHGWTFDVTTGQCQTNPEVVVPTYQVHVEGDAVCVKL